MQNKDKKSPSVQGYPEGFHIARAAVSILHLVRLFVAKAYHLFTFSQNKAFDSELLKYKMVLN